MQQYIKILLRKWVFWFFIYFLTSLNSEFDQVTVQIIQRDLLPLLNETLTIIREEERWRNVTLENFNFMDGSTLSISKLNVNEVIITTAIIVVNAKNSRKMEGWKQSENDSFLCNYYHKNHHIRENYWKLHGKSSNFFGKNNDSWRGNSCYKFQSYVVDIETKHLENIITREIFN